MGVDTKLLIDQLAEQLDITPVKARNMLAMRDTYSRRPHIVIVLRSDIPVDVFIMRGMGWQELYH